ncbi:MAG: MAPEG family protein [Candidatus Binataceae bacterium]
MIGVQLIVVLALIEYLAFGFNVGRARSKYDIKAPAITGHPIFERHFRVHQNMLEQLIVFIPALIIFAHHVSMGFANILGILFLIARPVYAFGYVKDPGQRAYGAGLTALVNAILVVGSLIGLLIGH